MITFSGSVISVVITLKNSLMNPTTSEIAAKIASSVEQLYRAAAKNADKTLTAIGIVTTDSVLTIAARVLYDGDLPANAETYMKLSPVEWIHSEEDAFKELNQFLAANLDITNEKEAEYKQRVRYVYDEFRSAFERFDFRKQFGESFYLTFAGVDPNSILESEEKRFVKLMNSPSVFEEWCAEFD